MKCYIGGLDVKIYIPSFSLLLFLPSFYFIALALHDTPLFRLSNSSILILISSSRYHQLTTQQFAQELLSTFSTSLGEVALQPSTGGTFIVNLYTAATTSTSSEDGEVHVLKHLLWDRKAEGGFPG